MTQKKKQGFWEMVAEILGASILIVFAIGGTIIGGAVAGGFIGASSAGVAGGFVGSLAGICAGIVIVDISIRLFRLIDKRKHRN